MSFKGSRDRELRSHGLFSSHFPIIPLVTFSQEVTSMRMVIYEERNTLSIKYLDI